MTLALPGFFHLVARERVGSTNEEALLLAAGGAPSGTLVWAREQSDGKGRRGRMWTSPPGNLYCSTVLRPERERAAWGQVSFVAAVAVAEAIGRAAPNVTPQLKWPNDVLVGARKLAGILLEASEDSLVVGLGVNVASYPPGEGATSLAEQGAGVTVEVFLSEAATAFLNWWQRWERHGFSVVRAAWLERAVGLGTEVEVRMADETLSGTFEALDETGALVLSGGRRISAGDVVFGPAVSGA